MVVVVGAANKINTIIESHEGKPTWYPARVPFFLYILPIFAYPASLCMSSFSLFLFIISFSFSFTVLFLFSIFFNLAAFFSAVCFFILFFFFLPSCSCSSLSFWALFFLLLSSLACLPPLPPLFFALLLILLQCPFFPSSPFTYKRELHSHSVEKVKASKSLGADKMSPEF